MGGGTGERVDNTKGKMARMVKERKKGRKQILKETSEEKERRNERKWNKEK